ncbi:MAG TPA: methylamine utilization protein [Thermoanaerobaculia bacterium]|nr:methylamine utilization protein [Thermoanaerobaculia bacterium]
MRRSGLVLVLMLLLAVPTMAEDLRGRLQLVGKGGKGPARGSDVRQALVWYEPASGGSPARPPATPFVMTTRDKQFVPRVLTVPKGSRVRFPNEDVILHNVFSVSGKNSFDLGLYRKGAGKEHRFDEPGLVRVFCNVHHSMVGYILVLDSPYVATPDANGDFVLAGVPRGAGRLTVWHEQGELTAVEVQVPRTEPLATRLEIVRPRIPPHLNKAGKSYSTRDRYNQR